MKTHHLPTAISLSDSAKANLPVSFSSILRVSSLAFGDASFKACRMDSMSSANDDFDTDEPEDEGEDLVNTLEVEEEEEREGEGGEPRIRVAGRKIR